jgi:16S rRNA (cytosine1402-N4)-methyltransferase
MLRCLSTSHHNNSIDTQKQKLQKNKHIDCWLGDLRNDMSKNTPQQLHSDPEGVKNPKGNEHSHTPVLLEQTVHYLDPNQGNAYLDLTAGYGGHAKAIIGAIGDASLATLVDRDEHAIQALQDLQRKGAKLLHMDFAQAAAKLTAEGKQYDIILIDLGVSSPQLDKQERGFSFSLDGPLDMRMDQRESIMAADIVNRYPQAELKRIIHEYGQESESASRRIATAITHARPLKTTRDLARLIERTHRGPRSKIHPATRTFQAIRIAVNQELKQIQDTLPYITKLLKPGGRVVIISFHSLEDRLVKHYFSELASAGYEAELEILTKKPIGGAEYDVNNPRARSAKLRAAVKK